MSLHRHQLRFVIALVLLAVAFAGLGAGVYLSRRSMRTAEQRLQRQQREWTAVQRISPSPTPTVASALTGDVAQAAATLETLQARLRGGKRAAALETAKVPVERMDAYFDLASYVERMRASAARHQVAVTADEHFGFSAYANGGPAKDRIPAVFRQRQVLEYLLEELMAVSPLRLEKVERGALSADIPGREAEQDLFAMDPNWSVRVPDFIDTLAFRISFTGETSVLRRWLDRLAKFELPVVVRMVEAAPLKGAVRSMMATSQPHSLVLAQETPSPQPLVERSPVRFTVTFEYLQLVPPAKEEQS